MKIIDAWVKRSNKYKDEIEGVLPKSLPRELNRYLDDWMYEVIKNSIDKKRKIKVLDLGCGYGRVSKRILRDFPDIKIAGVDVAKPYVDIYNKNLNPRAVALVGDIRNLKFEDLSFDVAIIVTTLMYVVSRKEQRQVIKKVKDILKEDGKIILIERNSIGYNIINLGGLIPMFRGKKFTEIDSTSFSTKSMLELLEYQKLKVLELKAVPFWTLLLPVEILIGRIDKNFLAKLLKVVKKLDSFFYWLLTPSLYISYIVVKDEGN